MRRLGLTLLTIVVVVIVCAVVFRVQKVGALRPALSTSASEPTEPSAPLVPLAQSATAQRNCLAASAFDKAAADNTLSQSTASVTAFGRSETGWEIYAPLIGREIGSNCSPHSSGFAAALARWQRAHERPADGRIRPQTLSSMAMSWLLARPFVRAMRAGCPPAPNPSTLQAARTNETFGGKALLARPAALTAYRQMVAAAKRDLDLRPPVLTLASAYRGPDEEVQRCAEGGCGGASKARCSAHRTGMAFDLYLGAAPGSDPFSSADANRLYQTKTPAYRWLVANADHFGFRPYPFEPWHWEWTGEPI